MAPGRRAASHAAAIPRFGRFALGRRWGGVTGGRGGRRRRLHVTRGCDRRGRRARVDAVGAQRRQVVVALGDRHQQPLPHDIVVLLQPPDLGQVALPGRVDLRRPRVRLHEFGLVHLRHGGGAVTTAFGALEEPLGGQSQQRLGHVGLACPDRQRDGHRSERLTRGRQPLQLVEQFLPVDLPPRVS